MTFDEWWEDFVAEHDDWKYADSEALRRAAFQAGAASRDAYIERLETGLLQVRKALCGDIHNTDDLLDLIASRDAEITELKYALGFDWDKFQASQEALRENMQLLSKATSDRAVLLSACETFMSHGVCEVSYYAIKDALAKVRNPT